MVGMGFVGAKISDRTFSDGLAGTEPPGTQHFFCLFEIPDLLLNRSAQYLSIPENHSQSNHLIKLVFRRSA